MAFPPLINEISDEINDFSNQINGFPHLIHIFRNQIQEHYARIVSDVSEKGHSFMFRTQFEQNVLRTTYIALLVCFATNAVGGSIKQMLY